MTGEPVTIGGKSLSAFMELQQLEAGFYQASFDLTITAVHIFVIDDPQDGVIVVDSSAPREERAENPIVQVLK